MFEDNERTYVSGQFGTSIGSRDGVWYGDRLVELMAVGEPGPRGGRPQRVQVLLSPEQASALRDQLAALVD